MNQTPLTASYIGDTIECTTVGWFLSDWIDEKKAEIKQGTDKIRENQKGLNNLNADWDNLYNTIRAAGFPENIVPFATAQALFESNNGRSHVAKVDTNFSGIKFRNRPGTSKGLKSPEGDHYAHYATLADWVKDFKRVLSQKNVVTKNSKGGPAAIEAQDLRDYVKRLKINGYYGGSEADYYRFLKMIMSAHSNIPTLIKRQDDAIKFADKVVDRAEHPFTSLLPSIPMWGKIGLAALLGLVIVKAVK